MKILNILIIICLGLFGNYLQAQPLACNPTADPDHICVGESSQLYANASGGSGSYTYSWSSDPPGFSSDIPDPVVFPAQLTTFNVTIVDGYNTVNGSVTVYVYNELVVQASPDFQLCQNYQNDIKIQNIWGGNNFSTVWYFMGNPVGNDSIYSVSWSEYGSYAPNTLIFTCEVTDMCGHTDSDEVQVTFSPIVEITGVPLIYLGETIQLTCSDGQVYDWLYGSLNGPPIGNNSQVLNYTPATTGFFIICVSIINDCDEQADTCFSFEVQDQAHEIFINTVAQPENICIGDSSQLIANATGVGYFEFYWTSNPEGFVSSLANPFVNPSQTTLYILEATNGFNIAVDSVWVFVHAVPIIFSLSNGGTICPGSEGIELFLSGSESTMNYELFRNSSQTGTTIPGTGYPVSFGFQNQEGDYYAVGYNIGCQVQMEHIATIHYANFKDEICIISVDSVSGKNVLIWDKTQDEAIDSYNIYRESSTGGSFDLIGNSPYDDPGVFTDNSSNPLQRSFSYGLKTVDTCSNESAMSAIHTTMHLSINTGINAYNLIWTSYSGFDYQTYFIYRRQLPEGFQVIDSVPNSVISYSDLNPPAGVLDYLIEIRKDNDCTSKKGYDSNLSILSNIISTNVGVNEFNSTSGDYIICPNPAKDILQITSSIYNTSPSELFFYDLQGRMIFRESLTFTTSLNLQGVDPGIYMLIIRQENRVENHKVIVY